MATKGKGRKIINSDSDTEVEEIRRQIRKDEEMMNEPGVSMEIDDSETSTTSRRRRRLRDKAASREEEVENAFLTLRKTIEKLRDFADLTQNLHKDAKTEIFNAVAQLVALEVALDDTNQVLKEYVVNLEEAVNKTPKTVRRLDKHTQTQKEIDGKSLDDRATNQRNCKEMGIQVGKDSILSNKRDKSNNRMQIINKNVEMINERNMLRAIGTKEGNASENWSVVLRKGKKNTPSKSPARIATSVLQKKPKQDAIEIQINEGEDLSQILRKVKDDSKIAENSENIERMRRTRRGNFLIELKKGCNKTDELRETIQNVIGQRSIVKALVPMAKIEILDIDEIAEKEDVLDGLRKILTEEEINQTKLLAIYTTFGNMQKAVVLTTCEAAKKLFDAGRVLVGWLSCRVRIKEEVQRCFRCQKFGHMANDCKGEDRSLNCRRCGETGHFSRDCKNDLRCMMCKDRGLGDLHHWMGSSKCSSFKQNEGNSN